MTDISPAPAALRLGDKAPDFQANTTHGPLKFSEWSNGNWVILFSHPADFTPVCSTELTEFARRSDEFTKLKTKLIGVSIDSIHSHLARHRCHEHRSRCSRCSVTIVVRRAARGRERRSRRRR
jgi:alkyl hydroperoxide reductase subunit AhpC